MKNDDRRGENRGRSENRDRSENRGQSRRSNGQNRSNSPRVGAIYSGVPAARRADASNENEHPAEYRGNSYRGERRESASARTYERGDASYNRGGAGRSHQGRESNHARRDDAAGNFGAARSGEFRRGGASDRQWSDESQRGFSEISHERKASRCEFSDTSSEQWASRRANNNMTSARADEYSASASEAYASEPSTRNPSIPPEENENLLAGRNPIREALKAGRSVEKLLVARGDLSGAARDLVRMAKEAGAVVQEVDRSRLDAIYPAHQGLLAYVAAVDYASVDDLFARAEERGEPPFFVLLDGVTDPHNLGAILRTAECAGAHGAILPERRSAGLGPAAAKAAAGALDCLPVARVKNLNRTIDELKERGVWVIGTAMEGEDALSADLSGPVALVIGSEGEGVSRLTLEKCDRTLTLPMCGRIESLNASVAAGILMYEVVRARAK